MGTKQPLKLRRILELAILLRGIARFREPRHSYLRS